MTMPPLRNYDDLRRYLASVINFAGNEGPYDLVGITLLALTLLDNLRTHGIPSDVETICDCMTPDQVNYILKLAESLRSHRPENSD
jgi:hypothetical protein